MDESGMSNDECRMMNRSSSGPNNCHSTFVTHHWRSSTRPDLHTSTQALRHAKAKHVLIAEWVLPELFLPIPHRKSIKFPRRLCPIDVDVIDTGVGWAASDGGEERFEGGPWTFGFQIDGAVVFVAHPAGEAERPRLIPREGPKVDPLHPPGHTGRKAFLMG